MIQSAQDLAELLAHAVRPLTDGESGSTEPITARYVTPPQCTFVVTTVEGRLYRVIVREEEPGS